MVKKGIKQIKEYSTPFFLIALCIFLFTIPYKNNYSNIGIILLFLAYILSFDINAFKDVINSTSWKLLFLNSLIFLLGLLLIDINFLESYTGKIGKVVLLLLLPILTSPFLKLTERKRKIVFFSFAFSIIIGMCLNYIYAIFLFEGDGNPFSYSTFTKGMGETHPAYISMFAGMSFFIVLEEIFITSKMIKKIILAVMAIFLFSSVIVLYARTPIIALIISLFVYIIWKLFNPSKVKNIIIILSIIFLSVLILYLSIGDNQFILIKDRLINNTKLGLSIRFESWECSWKVFKNGSWLFGVGSGNVQPLLNDCYYNSYLTRQYFSNYNSHNEYLMILVRNGIIGLVAWLIFIFYSFYISIKSNNILAIIFLLLFSICGLTEVFLNRIWGVLFFGAFYSILIINNKKLLVN